MPLAVVEGHAVQHDAALIRCLDARNAAQRLAFAAAGSAQQAGNAAIGLKPGAEMEPAIVLFNLHQKTHRVFPFCFCSSMFTASSTTAEMARLTSTQRNASASLSVRQSW